jgi:hypothetical protein
LPSLRPVRRVAELGSLGHFERAMYYVGIKAAGLPSIIEISGAAVVVAFPTQELAHYYLSRRETKSARKARVLSEAEALCEYPTLSSLESVAVFDSFELIDEFALSGSATIQVSTSPWHRRKYEAQK